MRNDRMWRSGHAQAGVLLRASDRIAIVEPITLTASIALTMSRIAVVDTQRV
jgi:hypothetical protein